MKQLSILITVLVMSSLALSGKVYPGLKSKGDYKKLSVMVESITKNAANLTKEQVETAIKLRLLRNGIKTSQVTSTDPHYLYVNISIGQDGMLYAFSIEFWKYAIDYGVDQRITGVSFIPNQGRYGGIGLSGRESTYIIEHLENKLDTFILDYLESNME